MHTCFNCDTLTDDEFTITISVDPDETDWIHDFNVVLCSDCGQIRQDGAEEDFQKMAEEYARKKAHEREGVESN